MLAAKLPLGDVFLPQFSLNLLPDLVTENHDSSEEASHEKVNVGARF